MLNIFIITIITVQIIGYNIIINNSKDIPESTLTGGLIVHLAS